MSRTHSLRPPGALPEAAFLKRCIQCGRCVQVCPYASLSLATVFDLAQTGTPFLRPRRAPCFLCLRCPPACPTGALGPVSAPAEVRMGRAFLDQKRCLTYAGEVLCKTCHEKCPLRHQALVMDLGMFPVITDKCVGCGVCENVCPAAAIVTLARADLPPGRGGEEAPAATGGKPS